MRFIIVTGGVLSGLGKGIVSSSIGLLLKARGYSVTAIKIDPYVSVDAGTMRPAEHGEVFVTHDGGEIDQDIGHYERFLNISLSKDNNITTGKVFQSVIYKERHFFYKGRDAELVPDVINEIKDMIYNKSKGFDFTIVEVGGTTGDLENMPFLHAAREIGREHKSVYVMVSYLPFLRNVGELKTKPTQHAVSRLREIGIMPDFIVTRNEIPIDKPRIETLAKRCFVSPENIIDDPDLPVVHELPLRFEKSHFAEKILTNFGLNGKRKVNLSEWEKYVKNLENCDCELKVALVGKYVVHGADNHKDVYISVLEALNHAANFHNVNLQVDAYDAEKFENMSPKQVAKILNGYSAIVAPQGWGKRGAKGKIRAIEYARNNKVPYLGLCFGMQMASVEFAKNVLGIRSATSEEFKSHAKDKVVHLMPDQKKYLEKNLYGATIRLGAWPCVVKKGTKLYDAYKKYGDDGDWFVPGLVKVKRPAGKNKMLIYERHRHRYEFNNVYKNRFEKAGMIVSGTSPDGKLVEAIELTDHPFFVGTQFHPEYLSRPLAPHPVFVSFVESALNKQN